MDNSACAVVYLDRRVQVTGSMTKELLQRKEEDHTTRHGDEDATHNINTIVSAFGEGIILVPNFDSLEYFITRDSFHMLGWTIMPQRNRSTRRVAELFAYYCPAGHAR